MLTFRHPFYKPITMTKTQLIILFYLINSICFCQTGLSGSVTYKKMTNPIDISKIELAEREQIIKLNKETDKIEYILNFNNEESYFYAKEILFENNSFKTYVTLGGGKLKLYQNNTTKECREFKDSKRVGKVIVDRIIMQDWTLTNESKIVSGYKCYKATTPFFNTDGTKRTDISSLIIAWYCPEIPISFGPVGYGKLPGLILELQTKANTFLAVNINLKPEKEVFIDKLTEPKAISEKELNERAMSSFNTEQQKVIQQSTDKK